MLVFMSLNLNTVLHIVLYRHCTAVAAVRHPWAHVHTWALVFCPMTCLK